MQLALRPDMTTGVVDCGPPGSATRLRPWVTAGIAIAGASLIAATPVAPPLPDIQARAVQLTADAGNLFTDVESMAGQLLSPASSVLGGGGLGDLGLGGVLNGLNLPDLGGVFGGPDLSSLPSPIAAYLDLFSNTFNSLGAIANGVLADPLPALQQILANQLGFANTISTGLQGVGSQLATGLGLLPAQLQTLFGDLTSGDLTGAATVINDDILLNLVVLPALSLLESGALNIPGEIAQNFANVVKGLSSALLLPGLGALGGLEGTITQIGTSGQAIVDTIGAGNPLTAFDAIAVAPARIADTFLNAEFGGLLSSFGLPNSLLVGIPQAIATALGAPAADSLAGLLDPATALGDISTAFDPSMVSDITSLLGADLAPNLVSGLLMDLPSMVLPF